MNGIVSVDQNWGIGYQNQLLARVQEDQKFFRETTTGKVVIMGRKTLESLPGKNPLKNRVNIVITSDPHYKKDGVIVVNSIEKARSAIKDYQTEDVFVIGGETIYRQMLPFCDTVYVTKWGKKFLADTFFPNLDQLENWRKTQCSEEYHTEEFSYYFCKYEICS